MCIDTGATLTKIMRSLWSVFFILWTLVAPSWGGEWFLSETGIPSRSSIIQPITFRWEDPVDRLAIMLRIFSLLHVGLRNSCYICLHLFWDLFYGICKHLCYIYVPNQFMCRWTYVNGCNYLWIRLRNLGRQGNERGEKRRKIKSKKTKMVKKLKEKKIKRV